MERVERLLLELAHAFGTNAEVGAEAAQRLHRPVEAIAAAQDRLLAARQARDPREKARERQPAGRTLVRLLGRWVRQPLTERVAAGTLIAAARLLERARHPLDRDQALHLRALDAHLTRELPAGRLTAVHPDVDAARVPHARKLARGTIRDDDRSAQLGHQLLHRLANPPRRIRPERSSQLRVIALERPQQPHHALLHQLRPPDPGRPTVAACDVPDQRRERLDQRTARLASALLRRQHQLPLAQLPTHRYNPPTRRFTRSQRSDPRRTRNRRLRSTWRHRHRHIGARRKASSPPRPVASGRPSELRRLKEITRPPRPILPDLTRDRTKTQPQVWRSDDGGHAAGLNRRKENEQSTNAGRWLRRHLPTNVPATGHLIDLDQIQPVLV